MAVALFMMSVDQTIVATALYAIRADLDAPIEWTAWTITIYTLGGILAMPIGGRISDQFGRKRVFVIATVVFTASSLLCGLANDIALLVAFRAVQSVGGGAVLPSATGIVADHFGGRRGQAVGMFASIIPIGGIVGPALGGVIVATWSWRGIFLINLPIGLILIVLALALIPSSPAIGGSRVDIRGIVLLGVLITSAMLGMTLIGDTGITPYHPVFLLLETTALGAGCLFFRHCGRHASPVVPVALLRHRSFSVFNLINLLVGGGVLGIGGLLPLYAQTRYGLAPLAAGSLLIARAAPVIAVAALTAAALPRTGTRLPMLVGYTIASIGIATLALTPAGGSPYVWLAIGAALNGLGMGMARPATTNANIHPSPEQAAAITGLEGMFRGIGTIVGVSLATAIVSRSGDAGATQAHVFLAFAVTTALIIPLAALVSDRRGRW